jgi:hypothetical protein
MEGAGGHRTRLAALAALVVVMTAYGWMSDRLQLPNEWSRMYLAVALVDDRALSIDGPVARFGPAMDWSQRDGRYYTDKAPGVSALAAMLYAPARLAIPTEDWTMPMLLRLGRVGLMLPVTLLGFLALRAVLTRLAIDASLADACGLAWSLGTTTFYYGGAIYGHHVVAVALLGALLAGLRAVSAASPAGAAWAAAAAGTCLGVAGMTEYQSAGPCVIGGGALAVALARQRRRWAIAALGLAAAPWLAALLGYHALAFGGPFELPYHHLVSSTVQELHERGIGGVGLPTLEAFNGVTLSLHRGLLATSPILLFALPGLWAMQRAGREDPAWAPFRRLWLPVAAGLVFYLAFASSADAWFGGWSFGPRLLVPIFGVGMVPVACLLQRARRVPQRRYALPVTGLALGCAWAGVLYNQIVVAFFPELPETVLNPVFDVVLVQALNGLVAPNLVAAFTPWTGLATLLPLAVLVVLLLVLLAVLLLDGWPAGSARRRACALALLPPAALALAIVVGPRWSVEQRLRWAAFVASSSDTAPP